MTTKRIIRAPRSADHPYFVCRRAPAQDKRLTWESRGVLWYILSKPDDWEVLEKDLMQHCGRDKVKKILKELEEKGYLVREQTRTKTEKGQTRYGALTFQVQEIPIQLTESQLTETQLTETQLTENPDHTEKEERSTETTEDTEKLAQPDKSVAPAPQSDQTVSDVVEEPPVSTPAPKARKPRPRDLWIDTIAECVFKVKPGGPLGKRTGPRCGTIKSEILTMYPDMTPEKFRQIVAWKTPYISEDAAKIVKMIGEYELYHKFTVPLAPLTVTHPDPACARCGGVGYLLPPVQLGDPDYGQHIPCSACLEKERQNGQRA